MKRLLFFMICVLTTLTSYSQRYIPGQEGIQVIASAVDGFHFEKDDKQAYSFSLAYSVYNKSQNRWVIGVDYLQKQFQYKDILLPVSQFTGDIGFYKKILSDPSKTFFFSAGISGIAGYETTNWGKTLLFDGASIEDKGGFIYGGSFNTEIETFITDRFVLIINAREKVLFGKPLNRFRFQLGVGFKYIIN